MKTLISKLLFVWAFVMTMLLAMTMIIITAVDVYRLLFTAQHTFGILAYLTTAMLLLVMWMFLALPAMMIGAALRKE